MKQKPLYKSQCCGAKVKWSGIYDVGNIVCVECSKPCSLTLTKAGIEASVASNHSLSYPIKQIKDCGVMDHDFKHLKRFGRADWRCPKCNKNVMILLVFAQQANIDLTDL